MNAELISIIVVIIGALVSIFKIVWPLLSAKLTETQLANITLAIKIAMLAAEQIFKAQSAGQDKKEFVVNYIKSKFPNLAEEEIDILIEGIGKELGLFN